MSGGYPKGQSLLEVIVAMAIFGLLAASMTTLALGGFSGLEQGGEHIQANALAQEGVEAVKAIKYSAWNELIFSTTSVFVDGGEWIFSGEGNEEQIGQYTRRIYIEDVCRSAIHEIIECPGVYTDVHTKKVRVQVSWPVRVGVENTVERISYITNWDSKEWTQTNWSGGSGQDIFIDEAGYVLDSGTIDTTSEPGEVRLAALTSAACGVEVWPFSNSALYSFEESDIAVQGGVAALVSDNPGGTAWWNSAYRYRQQITVETGGDSPVNGYDGYTVRSISLNTNELVTSGKTQSDCDDIRIVYDNGSSLQELDRHIVNCGATQTDIRFQLQSDILADASDSNYYLYYGNTIAESPPESLDQVYLWYDSAGVGSLGNYVLGRADAWHGTGYSPWSYNLSGYYAVDTGDNFTGSMRIPILEQDAYIEAEFYHTGCYENNMTSGLLARYVGSGSGGSENSSQYYATNRGENPTCGGGYGEDGDIVKGDRTATVVNGINPVPISTFQWRKQAFAVWGAENTNLTFWDVNDTASFGNAGWSSVSANTVGVDTNGIAASGQWGIIAAQDAVRVRNILLRRYTNPEPVLRFGQEERGASYPTYGPAIEPNTSLAVPTSSIGAWTSFAEQAEKGDGDIYYQLSDTDGLTWKYWNGVQWSNAGAGDYNTATVVNEHITGFPTSTGNIRFRAFLVSDGMSQIQLDEVRISCEQYYDWPFTESSAYSFSSSSIAVGNGVAGLLASDTSGSTIDPGFSIGNQTGLTYNFTTATEYIFDSQLEIVNGYAQLSEISSGNLAGIADTVIDAFEFEPVDGRETDILRFSNDIYVIASRDAANDGFIRTVRINENGDIENSVIDTIEYAPVQGRYPHLIKISDSAVGVVYTGPGADGFVSTILIDQNGVMTNTVVDSLEFDTTQALYAQIIHLQGDVYAIAYQGSGGDGYLATVQIDQNGIIANSILDVYEFDQSNGRFPDLIKISNTVVAIAYRGDGADGYLITIPVSLAGTITSNRIGTFEFDTRAGDTPDIIGISDDVYAIAYKGPGNDGWIQTVRISSVGDIDPTSIDSFEFDASNGFVPEIYQLTNNYYLLAYRGTGSQGVLLLVRIFDNGDIDTIVDTFNSGVTVDFPGLEQVSEDIYAIAYQGPDADGWISTIGLERAISYSTTTPALIPISSYVVPGVAQWESFTEVATKNSGEIYYQLSDDDGASWKYWDGGIWADAVNTGMANTAAEINTGFSAFPTTAQQIMFKALFESDGATQVQLDQLVITNIPGVSPWTFFDYDVGSGEQIPVGSIETTGGNPGQYASVSVPFNFFGQSVGGYWQQSIDISEENALAEVELDYRVFGLGLVAPTVSEIRVYLDTAAGNPVNQVATIPVSSIGSWTSAPTIDVSSAISSAGTYYLKVAYWVETSFFGCECAIGIDNVQLSWQGNTYATDLPTINPSSTLQVEGVAIWNSFIERANKNGGEIYYQLSSDGEAWNYWDGAAWVNATETDYNTADEVNQFISFFPTSTGVLSFRAFLESNGSQLVELDNIRVAWGESDGTNGGSGFETSGYLLSSAFPMQNSSPVQVISWDEAIPECAPACEIRVQVRTAPNDAGAPGVWTSWFGESGIGTYFTQASGTLVPVALNGNQWVQYRAELIGDGNNTPVLKEIQINYK